MTVDLRYVGPFDQVHVPLATGGEINVAQGAVATFPDDMAESLLDQPSNWRAVLDGAATNDELRAELEKLGVSAAAKATKQELVELLEAAQAGGTQDDAGGDPPGDQAGNGETT